MNKNVNKIIVLIKNFDIIISKILNFIKLDDENFIKIIYHFKMKKKLDLNNPKSFNEKLQWLKLYDRKDIYTTMVDKYAVKKYVADIIGEEYIIPTLGIYNSFDEIDFDELPNQFVIKCTHDSGGLVIVKDKSKLDVELAKKKINKSLKSNYYYQGREWPYKNVKPRIIAERYMIDKKENELKDYKFFCFNGKVKFFKVDFDRFTNHHANYYDVELNLLPFGEKNYLPDREKKIIIPDNINEMIDLAEKLSKNITFVRVDFYNVNGKIYFGEMTFYPASGFGKFEPDEWDEKIGDMLELPIKSEEKNEK